MNIEALFWMNRHKALKMMLYTLHDKRSISFLNVAGLNLSLWLQAYKKQHYFSTAEHNLFLNPTFY